MGGWAGAVGVLWEGGRCRQTERAAAAQLRVLAEDQMALSGICSGAFALLLRYQEGSTWGGKEGRNAGIRQTQAQVLGLLFRVVAVSRSCYPSVSVTESGSLNTPVQPPSPVPSSVLEHRMFSFPVSLAANDTDPAQELEWES